MVLLLVSQFLCRLRKFQALRREAAQRRPCSRKLTRWSRTVSTQSLRRQDQKGKVGDVRIQLLSPVLMPLNLQDGPPKRQNRRVASDVRRPLNQARRPSPDSHPVARVRIRSNPNCHSKLEPGHGIQTSRGRSGLMIGDMCLLLGT